MKLGRIEPNSGSLLFREMIAVLCTVAICVSLVNSQTRTRRDRKVTSTASSDEIGSRLREAHRYFNKVDSLMRNRLFAKCF